MESTEQRTESGVLTWEDWREFGRQLRNQEEPEPPRYPDFLFKFFREMHKPRCMTRKRKTLAHRVWRWVHTGRLGSGQLVRYGDI